METDILDRKLELIQWLSAIEDKTIIDKLVKFKQQESKDWWGDVSIEEKNSIEKGIADADNNQLAPHITARKIYEKWL